MAINPKALHWWQTKPDSGDALSMVTDDYKVTYEQNSGRGRAYGEYERLYKNPSEVINGLGGGSTDTLNTSGYSSSDRRLSVPLCASVIDTLSSKMASDRPRPFFCTSGGTTQAQETAKNLQAFGDGAIYETDLYAKTMLAFKDAGKFGDGFIGAGKDQNDRLAAEVLPPCQILIPLDESNTQLPRTAFRWMHEDVDLLCKLYPKAKGDILKCYEATANTRATNRRYLSNKIHVVHAWHLPTSSMEETDAGAAERKTDGRHILFIPQVDPHNGAVILDEPWYRHEFPFVKLSFNPTSDSYWSQGVCAALGNLQTDVNTMMRRVQRSMHLHSNPHWITYRGAQMQFGSINSGMGTEVRVAAPGLEPKLESFAAMGADVYQHIETQIERFYQFSGVSTLSAQSQKPAGLNSGEAIRTYNDLGSERFQALGKRFEAFFVCVMKLFLETVHEIAQEKETYPVKYIERRAAKINGGKIESFDFKNIKLDAIEYVIQISPVDSLSNSVSGRIQMVSEMAQSGAPMDPLQLYSLLELPDTPAYFKRLFARRDLVERCVYSALNKGKFVDPNAYMDLDYAVEYATQEVCEAQLADDVPDDRIELLQQWLDAVTSLQASAKEAAAAAAQAAMPPAPGQPPAGPGGVTQQPVAPLVPQPNPGNSGQPNA